MKNKYNKKLKHILLEKTKIYSCGKITTNIDIWLFPPFNDIHVDKFTFKYGKSDNISFLNENTLQTVRRCEGGLNMFYNLATAYQNSGYKIKRI